MIRVIFTAIDVALYGAIKERFSESPSWSIRYADVFHPMNVRDADILVSPANEIGRMDGGVDQVYINRFGWQLEHRLMRDIRELHRGKVRVGEAYLITTYDPDVPLMICAPTMAWPPGDVSHTRNAYHACLAAFHCAATAGVKALGRFPTVLMPGMCTHTGKMAPEVFAAQAYEAWTDFTFAFCNQLGSIPPKKVV